MPSNGSSSQAETIRFETSWTLVTPTTQATVVLGSIISDETANLTTVIGYGIICQTIIVVGTILNVINIVVFVKQGFKDSVSVALLGLSISDLGALVSMVGFNMAFLTEVRNSGIVFLQADVQYLVSCWVHVMFSKTTLCITTLITLERCLCVTLPGSVSGMFTPRRTAAVVTVMFVAMFTGIGGPLYSANGLGWTMDPVTNVSSFGLVFSENREVIESAIFALSSVILPCFSFASVGASTAVLVYKLKASSQWRAETSGAMADNSNRRDRKVTRMVVAVATMFIACLTPTTALFLVMAADRRFWIEGQFKNIYLVSWSMAGSLECLNSAVNFFIYYNMSSKFKATFDQMLGFSSNAEK